jgi:hypothetical protein
MTATIQQTLTRYETDLLGWEDSAWDRREWPDPKARAGMRLHRLWRKVGDDQIMLHRFLPEPGDQAQVPHPHPMAVAAHVLGPGEYELGFVVGKTCLTRMICDRPFYYEMISRQVRHYVLPRTGPIYSVALWTPYRAEQFVPVDRLAVSPEPEKLLAHVQGAFDRTWGPVAPATR